MAPQTNRDVINNNALAVSLLCSHHRFAINPFTPLTATEHLNYDFSILRSSPYPTRLPDKYQVLNTLCTRLLRYQTSRSKSAFTSVNWFPELRRFLATNSSAELTVWDASSFMLEDVKRLPESSGSLTTTEWLQNGSIVATGDWGGGVHLSSSTLSPLTLLRDLHGHSILELTASPTGEKLAGAANDVHPVLWDLQYGIKERSFSELGFDITCIQWHPSQGLIATGSQTETLAFWDPKVGKPIWKQLAHKGALIAISPCGSYIATAGRDNVVRLWSIAQQNCMKQFRLSDSDCRNCSLRWHPTHSPRILICGDSNGDITYFDMSLLVSNINTNNQNPVLAKFKNAHEQQINSLSMHPLGHMLCTAGSDGKLNIWTSQIQKTIFDDFISIE